jgi:3-phosphoshikimate 1-carboxyvinyltransferase
MRERPMKDLFDALRTCGAAVETTKDHLPAKIHAHGLRKIPLTIDARKSSQYASALLLVGLNAQLSDGDEPSGYTNMTRVMVRRFRPDWTVEPDLSSGTYFLAAGFLTGGHIEVLNWRKDSLQMDGHFPSLLPPPARVSRLTELGDSVLALAICALVGSQPLQIVDASRLRVQETDRIKAMVTELRRVGAKAEEYEDGFTVWPAEPGQLHGADIETYNDHRMAMCFAVLGLKVPGIRIKNPGCVSKTFPNFFDKLEQLRT